MASQTTNLNLKKPALDDDALITDINGNMDLIDTYAGTTNGKINATNALVGIVATGSTAPKAISKGQYVIWNGALYTAKSAISSGTTLSSSNLQSVDDGGLNDLAKIGTIVSSEHSESGRTLNANNSTVYANNSITLTAGKWIVFGTGQISHAVAGTRQGFTITTNNAPGEFSASRYDLRYQTSDVGNVNQYYNVHGIVELTASTTFYAMIYNGNITFNCWTGLYAIRIK